MLQLLSKKSKINQSNPGIISQLSLRKVMIKLNQLLLPSIYNNTRCHNKKIPFNLITSSLKLNKMQQLQQQLVRQNEPKHKRLIVFHEITNKKYMKIHQSLNFQQLQNTLPNLIISNQIQNHLQSILKESKGRVLFKISYYVKN